MRAHYSLTKQRQALRSLYALMALVCLSLLAGFATTKASGQEAKKPPFLQYDDNFTNTITTNWLALLAKQKGVKHKNGEVTLEFHLTDDGKITDMKVLKDTVGDDLSLVCRKAVLAGVPYEPWPPHMLYMVGRHYRVITFTFYYKDGGAVGNATQ